MKVAIMTLHFVNHYGSLLQTYATCRLFEKLGHTTEVVDYIRPNNTDEMQGIMEGLKKKGRRNPLFSAAYVLTKRLENRKREKFSRDFLQNNVSLTSRYQTYQDLLNAPPEADVYCTGSDQVWNSEYNGGYLPEYFLEFAPSGKKRIAFSASIGMDRFPEAEYAQTRDSLMKYSAISVREASAQSILKKMGLSQTVQVLDPTLCLSKQDWMPLIAPRKVRKPYVLLYKLNDAPELERFVEELSERKGLQIIRVSYYLNHFKNQGKMIYSPSVGDFLSLINYADCVVTDSFHAVAFSINFSKDLYAFYPGQYSTRIESILKLTGAEHRAVNTPGYADRPINYEYVNQVLNKERERAETFIRQALDR